MKRRSENNWHHKTLESLEKRNFGNPSDAPTNMIRRCLALCKVPLDQFTVEDLRLMIEQNFSLHYLIPLAITHLRTDVFAEGDLFPGDLLKTVLLIDNNFWKENKSLWTEIDDLIKHRRNELSSNKIPTTLFDSAFDG